MILEQKLVDTLEKENIYAFETSIEAEFKYIVLLKSASIDELIKFIKVNNLNSIFYNYSYYYKEDYKVALNDAKLELGEDIYMIVKNDILNHNKKIGKIDFSRPKILAIYTIYQGKYIGIIISDFWVEETEELLESEELLNRYIEKYEKILEEGRAREELERTNSKAKLKVEFEKFIMNDTDFLICTNQQLRRNYAKNVFDKIEANIFREAFYYRGILDRNSVIAFVESIWKKYKNNQK